MAHIQKNTGLRAINEFVDKSHPRPSLIELSEATGLTPQRGVCRLRTGLNTIHRGYIPDREYWGEMAGVEFDQYGCILSTGKSQSSWTRGGQGERAVRIQVVDTETTDMETYQRK